MSMKNHPLEMYVADRLSKILGEKCRPTKASGASTEILDVYNSMFFVECKMTKKTDNFVINFKDVDKAYKQAGKILGTDKKVLFIMQNKSEDRIVLMNYNDLIDLVGGEENFEKIFAMEYIHFDIGKGRKTFYKEDWDVYYNNLLGNFPNRIPVIVFHDRQFFFYSILDLEDFFYVLEKYIVNKG